MIILEIAVGVLLARIVGDALGAFIIIQRSKKRKAKAVAQLEQWQSLLAEQEARSSVALDGETQVIPN